MELSFEYKDVKVRFTESDTKPLFVECYFQRGLGNIWFEISRTDFIDRLMSLFTKNKLESANKEFNKKYLILGANTQKVREIINNEKIIKIILSESITFVGGKNGKDGKFRLTLNIHRNVNSPEQLETIYNFTVSLIELLF